MRALVTTVLRDIRCDTVDDPTPRDRDGAVVRITRAGICGSDLHIYHGHGFHRPPDTSSDTKRSVKSSRSAAGDALPERRPRLIPASTGCAHCDPCRKGRVSRCENQQMGCYGLGHDLPGSQGEAVAVPAADTGLLRMPEGIDDDQAILLTDNLPTAWFGARRAGIKPGDTVAVIGLGPVGLCAVASALAMGASRVFAIDLLADRRNQALAMGAIPIEEEDPTAAVLEKTGGIGCDCVVEAVGADATIDLACVSRASRALSPSSASTRIRTSLFTCR